MANNLNLLVLTRDVPGIGNAGDVVADRAVVFVDSERFKVLASASATCQSCAGAGSRTVEEWDGRKAAERELGCPACKAKGRVPVEPEARGLPAVSLDPPRPKLAKLGKKESADGNDS